MEEQREVDSDGAVFARNMLDADPASQRMGMRVLRVAPGSATVSMRVSDDMLNGHDITHGGFVFALADTAFALACNGYGRTTVAAAAAITFVASTSAGDQLVADAAERVRWGRSGVYDVTVRRAGEVVAEFRGTSREIGDVPGKPDKFRRG